MARLRDFLPAVRRVGFFSFVWTVTLKTIDDNVVTFAAAVAYAWLLAIFPFFIFLLTLVPYVPEGSRDAARDQIASSVAKTFPKAAADTVMSTLNSVLEQPKSSLLSIGLIVSLWIASGGISMTMSALDAAFDAKKLLPFYKQRPIAIGLTLAMTVLVIAVCILLPIGGAVFGWLGKKGMLSGVAYWSLNILRYGMAVLLLLTMLALLFKFGTSTRRRFSLTTPGGVAVVFSWFVLAEGFRFYVDHFGSYQKMYGAVGGIAILMIYFYLTAFVLLVGAEINAAIDHVNAEETNSDTSAITAPARPRAESLT